MIKVLMMTDRMGIGGVETHIAQLARTLHGMGVHVSILSGGGEIADRLETEGIRQYRIPTPCKKTLRIVSLIRYVRRLVKEEGFQILHAHSRVCAFVLRFCTGLDATRIVTVHAMFSHNPILRRLCYWGERTIAVSEDLRTYVCRVYAIPAERVSVIPNGIDEDLFHAPAENAPLTPSILCASRLDRDCSLAAELLCQLAPVLYAKHPEIRIRIAGGGDRYAHVLRMASDVNTLLGKEVIQPLGFVENMAELMHEQAIFVGVSRAAMEASMCGCAVILCGNEGYFGPLTKADFAHAALTNFCARGCAAPTAIALADDLFSLLDNPDLRQKNGAECARMTRESFGARDMAQKTYALYRQYLPTQKQTYVTLAGYFGCGNMGDDAILSGITQELRTVAPGVGTWVLSGSPADTERKTGLPCFSRSNPLSILSSLLRSEALLLGGGSLFQNLTSNRSLFYYLFLIRLARCLRRPVMLFGIGIGPLLGERTKKRVARVLNRCNYIGLRDERSHLLLRELGVDARLLHTGADGALLLPSPPIGRVGAILREHGVVHNASLLCVTLHGGPDCERTRETVLIAIRLLCRRRGLTPLFPVLDSTQDEKAARLAAKSCAGFVLDLREVTDAVAVLSASELLISSRLHALVFAASVGTPCIGIAADERDGKIPTFVKGVGADVILPHELSVAKLVSCAEAAMDARAQIRPILLDSVSQMRKKARKDLANIVEMIYNKKQ